MWDLNVSKQWECCTKWWEKNPKKPRQNFKKRDNVQKYMEEEKEKVEKKFYFFFIFFKSAVFVW